MKPRNTPHRTPQETQRLVARLRRIEGQIRGIEKAAAANAECIEILRQINSASAALKGAWLQIMESHLKGCIASALKRSDESLVDELVEHIRKLK